MLHSNDVTVKLGKDRKIMIHENNQVEDWEITKISIGLRVSIPWFSFDFRFLTVELPRLQQGLDPEPKP